MAAAVIRFLLAVAFVVAGWAKLGDRAGTRQAVVDFGLPEALAAPVTAVLPPTELVIGVLLLFPVTAEAAAFAALTVLSLFIVAIAASLARGRRPDCHCFGQLSSKPVGVWALVRNAVLAAGAVYVLVTGALPISLTEPANPTVRAGPCCLAAWPATPPVTELDSGPTR